MTTVTVRINAKTAHQYDVRGASHCKYCGAPIVWGVTPNGEYAPLEPWGRSNPYAETTDHRAHCSAQSKRSSPVAIVPPTPPAPPAPAVSSMASSLPAPATASPPTPPPASPLPPVLAESAIEALWQLLRRRGLTLGFQDEEILIHGPAHRITDSILLLVERYEDELWEWAEQEGLTDITLVCSWCGCDWTTSSWDAAKDPICEACLAQMEPE
jgi:hypothetical protein